MTYLFGNTTTKHIYLKNEHFTGTAALCNKHLQPIPLSHITKELRSLVQTLSNPPELRKATHSTEATIIKKKKKKSVFRKAELSSAEGEK